MNRLNRARGTLPLETNPRCIKDTCKMYNISGIRTRDRGHQRKLIPASFHSIVSFMHGGRTADVSSAQPFNTPVTASPAVKTAVNPRRRDGYVNYQTVLRPFYVFDKS